MYECASVHVCDHTSLVAARVLGKGLRPRVSFIAHQSFNTDREAAVQRYQVGQ